MNRKYISKPNKKINWREITLYLVLGLVLSGAIFFYFNADYIYVQLGNLYFKHNEITKAQTLYEKAFRLGYKDSAIREIYVNSIINSPLTIEAQRKLTDFAEDNIQDKASLRAKSFLQDLRAEIYKQYPDNYIGQCPFNHKVVRWNRFPITYAYKNIQNVPKGYVQEIDKAFLEWEKAGVVLFNKTDSNADIIIDFRNNQSAKIMYGRKYVVAYTIPVITNSRLDRMDINFYIQTPEGIPFSNNQVYNTALHEIFHALGFMGHSFSPDNIMYLSKDNNVLINDSRAVLNNADKNTLKLLYKIQPDITNNREPAGEYTPYLVLGGEQDVNVSKAREARNYIYHAPALPSGYIELAESLAAEKRYSEAIRNLEKALTLSDTDEMKYISYYNLAVVYHYIGHTAMALEYIDKAKGIKDSTDLHFLKAEILLKVNKNLAEKEYLYLLEYSPDNADYVLRLANLYVQNKNYLKARSVLKSYLKRNPAERSDARFAPYKILLF